MVPYYKTFVAVGNCKQHFLRLLNMVMKCANILPQPILIQAGHTPFSHEKCDVIDFINMDVFIHHVEQSEILIFHGGAGSTMQAINTGKCPILVPRKKQFNEHVNDHQASFATMLHKEGKIMMAEDETSLKKAINEVLSQKFINTKGDISYSLQMIKQLLQQI